MYNTLHTYKEKAQEAVTANVWRYYSHAAGQGITTRRNTEAFNRYVIRPKVMRDVGSRSLSTHLLGHKVASPIQVGVTTSQDKAHPDGELATARAAGDKGVCMVVSIWSSRCLKQVANAAPTTLKWFQLHPFHNREQTITPLVRKAEEAGYKALVLTIDSRVVGREFGIGIADGSFGLSPLSTLPNVKDYPEPKYHDPSSTWEFCDWLKTMTSLPIVVKGVLTGDAAVEAVEHGAAAVIVSNQGGRHLDGTTSSIEALSEVVQAVEGRCEVYIDGGIRNGSDVLKALALGAKAVFLGRPVLWGLACDGAAGVTQVLNILEEELSIAMGLCGCRTIQDITPDLVQMSSYI